MASFLPFLGGKHVALMSMMSVPLSTTRLNVVRLNMLATTL